jgi:hypothetical protein
MAINRPGSVAARAIVAAALVATTATPGWSIGIKTGKEGPSTTVTFQPAVWEPYIAELYVKPINGEGHEKSILNMEKAEGALPGVRPGWKALKQRFGFDNLGERNDATPDIISGWTQGELGFLVHATSEITPSGDAKIVQQLLAEAAALFYVAVRIDFGQKLKADREAYLLEKYFKALELKINAHEIETSGTEFKIENIRGTSGAEPFLHLFNHDIDFNRPWPQLGGQLLSSGAYDLQLQPWRVERLVELRVKLEVEGKLADADPPERKKAAGAIRFVVLPAKQLEIWRLNWNSQKSGQ